ncbi:hypothetical protein AYX14_04280 [Cryptococcus neoformans]|nr:hypothetical protein AYX15_02986 [Cryptococcus neoformans var. grubii]OWZ70315.1 hypothetical protein AYX14_04280 [Cryptococcus neoformans var. grubii]OWZ78951.1 hypothetical protein C365_02600 [Cryptococcus neoformans var. grubii Bt85]OXG19601.1 hypothetical protein C366_02456 [Cryptococcus neoformans var. grubii Tu401-1]OXM80110.1 hypothetical protein C364_02418 [Cryptococcus neoformans var. grubii Bt63]
MSVCGNSPTPPPPPPRNTIHMHLPQATPSAASQTSHPTHHTPDARAQQHSLRRAYSTPSIAFPFPHQAPPSSALSHTSYTSNMSENITRYTPDGTPQSSASRPGSGSSKFPPSFDSPTPHGARYNSAVRMDGIEGAEMLESGDLAGIQPPATFPLPEYPASFMRAEPVPTEETEELQKFLPNDGSVRKYRYGGASCNPWDYMLGDVPDVDYDHPLSSRPARYGPDAKHGCKVRRRFTKRELEALEVLWSIAKSPSKYERQRLGAWLGVKTKHITVWFQNRRQEEKRYSRDGHHDAPPPSRSNRGTFDPVTGKWRPVPASCISGLQPPPDDKIAVVRAISLGDVTRDMWLNKYPSSSGRGITESSRVSPTPMSLAATSRGRTIKNAHSTPLLPRNQSRSLDQVLQARESSFGTGTQKRYRRGSGDFVIKGEGQDRIKEILSLMPSDPPSMGLAESDVEESDEDDGGIDEDVERRKRIKQAKASSILTGLGRATPYDVLASSSRAKMLAKPNNEHPSRNAVLNQLNPNLSHFAPPSNLRKHTLESVATNQPTKRHRSRVTDLHPNPNLHASSRTKDFNRSVSTSALPRSSRVAEDQGSLSSYLPSQLKTPNLGYTRSHSISSSSSRVITPEDVKDKREGPQVRGQARGQEKDQEVIGAAEMLLQLFGGS